MLSRGRTRPTSAGGAGSPPEASGSVLSRSIIGTGTRVGLIGITVANGVLVARALGPAGLGQLFLFVQLVAVLAVVADLGLSNGAAAVFGRDDAVPSYLHGLVLRILPLSAIAVTAVGGTLLALLHGTVLPHMPLGLLWMVFATLPFAMYCNVCFSMMAGLGRIKEASIAQLLGGTLWLVLTGIFVLLMRRGVVVAAAVYGLSLVLQAGVMAVMAVRIIGAPTRTTPAVGTSRRFTSFALRAFPGAVAYLLVLRLPAFILNVFHGPSAVGILSAAQQLAERTLLPAVAIQAAAYCTMSSRDRQGATWAINRYVRFCWWGMTAVVVAGMVLAGPVVHVLLGREYGAAAPLLRVLLPGALFSACALVLDTYFLNQLRRPGLLSLLCGAQAIVVAILGAMLVPHFSSMGAAVSLTLAQCLGALAYALWHRRLSGTTLRDLVAPRATDLTAFRRQTGVLLSRRHDG